MTVLRTLGPLALEGSTLTRPKPLLVLAYLAMEGPTARRDLAQLFFHDAADPRDSLATTLRHLRRAGAIAAGSSETCSVSETVRADAMALLTAFDAYRYADVERAYTGPFLESLDLAHGHEAETWVFDTREAIAARVRTASLHLAGDALVQARVDDARDHLRRALRVRGAPELEPDELGTALRLAQRLGLPEVAQLRATAQGYGLPVDAPHRPVRGATVGDAAILHRATRFVGRRRELDRLARLTAGGANVISIVGLGGVGKTRLALRFAQRCEADVLRYPDGVTVVAFDGVPGDVDVCAHVSRRIVPDARARDLDMLGAMLASERRLVVLDNVEHVRDAASFVDAVSRRCPDVTLLLTSRRRLAVEVEHVFDLDGLDLEGAARGRSDAAALFIERAVRVGYPHEAADRDRDTIDELCRQLGGHPLAIELAAAWTRLLGVAEIAATLRAGLDLLDDGPVDAPARHRAVTATLAPSVALLDAREARCLGALAAFEGSFAFDAAAAVSGASLPIMARLVDQALVRSTGGGLGRFELHPVLREYVRESTPSEVLRAARLEHQRFYASLLARSAASMDSAPAAVLDRLELDLPDVVTALHRALETDTVAGVAMATNLVVDADILQARPTGTDLLSLAEQAVDHAEARGDLDGARSLLVKIANARRVLRRDPVAANASYRRALEIAERRSDRHALVMLNAILGTSLYDDDVELAVQYLDTAEGLAGDDPLLVCEVLQRRGYIATRTDAWHDVRAINARAVALTTSLLERGEGDPRRVASLHYYCLHNLGGALDTLGEVDAALDVRHRALAFAESRGQRLWSAYARHEIASGLADAGRPDEAVPYARDARRIFRAIGAVDDLALLESNATEWGIDLDQDDRQDPPTDAA